MCNRCSPNNNKRTEAEHEPRYWSSLCAPSGRSPSLSHIHRSLSVFVLIILLVFFHSFSTTNVFISKYLFYLCLDFVKMHRILNSSVSFSPPQHHYSDLAALMFVDGSHCSSTAVQCSILHMCCSSSVSLQMDTWVVFVLYISDNPETNVLVHVPWGIYSWVSCCIVQ